MEEYSGAMSLAEGAVEPILLEPPINLLDGLAEGPRVALLLPLVVGTLRARPPWCLGAGLSWFSRPEKSMSRPPQCSTDARNAIAVPTCLEGPGAYDRRQPREAECLDPVRDEWVVQLVRELWPSLADVHVREGPRRSAGRARTPKCSGEPRRRRLPRWESSTWSPPARRWLVQPLRHAHCSTAPAPQRGGGLGRALASTRYTTGVPYGRPEERASSGFMGVPTTPRRLKAAAAIAVIGRALWLT